MCQKAEKDFKECCCAATVGKLWKDKLPGPVLQAVASYDHTNQFDLAMDRAYDVYNAMKKAAVSPAMAAVNFNETQPALQHDVAAVKAQAKAKPKGSAAGGTGSKPKRRRDPADRSTWGRPHKDFAGQEPPHNICMQHYCFGKSAHFCRRKDTCPWKSITQTPSDD